VSFLRSLLLLLALVSPAFSQDGPRDAATAQDAGQAFGIYLDGVLKSGGEPDFTKPPAADLFRHIFDVAALNALPPANADDIPWLLQWAAAVDQSYTRIILFGVKPGQAPAELVLRRNMAEYEDQCAMAMNFLIRFAARQATTLTLFLDRLSPEERKPVLGTWLQRARGGSAQTISGALTAMIQGMKPGNARLIASALRDTRDIWAEFLMPDDRTRFTKLVAESPATVKDRETQKNLAAFAGALAAAK
jgi:hypothetical protein